MLLAMVGWLEGIKSFFCMSRQSSNTDADISYVGRSQYGTVGGETSSDKATGALTRLLPFSLVKYF